MFPLLTDRGRVGRASGQAAGAALRRAGRAVGWLGGRAALVWPVVVAVVVVGVAGGVGAEDLPGLDELDELQRTELAHFIEDLRDSRLEPERRRRAAQILLTRDWPAATAAMKLDLRSGDTGTRRAVAQAIAAVDMPDPDLMEPLMDLLGAEDAALRGDVAAALGRFADEQVLERLMTLARGGGESSAERLGAIDALAQHRERAVVELLLEIAEGGEAWAVRSAAFESLARLSGLHTLGTDAEGWRQWWERASELSGRQWQASLLQNLSNRNAALSQQLQVTRDRLVSAQNRLYDATAESSRPAMLQQMLEDPMEDLRLLALRLIERRVLNAQPVGDEVRQVMRQRLGDISPAVRTRSATVLETLGDAEGAAMATSLLLDERSRSVQAAYLALISRAPTAEATEPALRLIGGEERVASAAADCLTAAFDAGLMSESQVVRARRAVRAFFAEGRTDRAMLRLLARVGEQEDLDVLVSHLRHDEGAVRGTAARAFGQGQWPLEPLLAVIDDSTLTPVVIEVVERRGQTMRTIEHLLDNEPAAEDNGDVAEAWRAALAAVASRLDAEAIAALDAELRERERPALHEQLLVAAAAMEDGAQAGAMGGRIEAALRLSRLRIEQGAYAEADAVHEWLASRNGSLTAAHRQRLALSRTSAMLRRGAVEEAATLNREILEAETVAAADLVEVWIESAELALNGGGDDEPDVPRLIIDTASELFEEGADQTVRDRLGQLRRQIEDPAAAATADEA